VRLPIAILIVVNLWWIRKSPILGFFINLNSIKSAIYKVKDCEFHVF